MMRAIHVLSDLFESIPLGVVVLDAQGRTIVFNRAEELLAGRPREMVLGREFFREVAPCMSVKQLGGVFYEKIGASSFDVQVEFSFPFPDVKEPRDVRVRMKSLDVGGEPQAFLLIEDVSNQRAVERMKETLQQLIVHDMKNPLAAVLGNLSLLEELPQVRDSADALEAITEGVHAARRVQRMLVDLLDITRLETNTFPLRPAPADLRDLARIAQEDNRVPARMCGARIEVAVPEAPIRATVDPDVLRRALDNLVENALRHARRVTVSAAVEHDAAVLEVKDDGPGIPADVRARIFEKFVQVFESGAKGRGHNRGLGLTFVQLAARAHGGDAFVDCPPEGGTRFRIVIPLQRPSPGRKESTVS